MLVSAIVPTYNRAHMIVRTLESIVGQTYKDLEVIVVDDGSTDGTEEVVRKYAATSPVPVIYRKKDNGGRASAVNKGIEFASGAFIGFLDSDDQWLPGAIEMLVSTLENSDAGFVYSPSIEVLRDGREFLDPPAAAGRPELFMREHFLTAKVRACAVLYRREVLERFRFDESIRTNEDFAQIHRTAMHFKAAYSPSPSAKVFHHDGNISGDRAELFRTLIWCTENILSEFPEFAESVGSAAQDRLDWLRDRMVESLILQDRVGEALAAASGRRLSIHIKLALFLKSGWPITMRAIASTAKRRVLNWGEGGGKNA